MSRYDIITVFQYALKPLTSKLDAKFILLEQAKKVRHFNDKIAAF